MLRRAEAGAERHLCHRKPRLLQQRVSLCEPHHLVMAERRLAEVAREEALELAQRKAQMLRDIAEPQRLLDVLRHQRDGASQQGIA